MSLGQAIILLVALQRLAELIYARRNTQRLLTAGGKEAGSAHYPLFIILHGSWLLALFVLVPADAPIHWGLIGLFVALQMGRIWVIASLGGRWTTRVITLPNAPLVRRGPYRWLRHPNYLIVAAEIAVLPLAFGAWQIALVFTALNLPLLAYRIRVEDRALSAVRQDGVTPSSVS